MWGFFYVKIHVPKVTEKCHVYEVMILIYSILYKMTLLTTAVHLEFALNVLNFVTKAQLWILVVGPSTYNINPLSYQTQMTVLFHLKQLWYI